MERQQAECWSTLVLETLANESKPWCDSALSESIQPLSDTLMWRHASRWTVFQGKWREMQAEGSFNTAGIQLNKPHYQESRQTDRKPSHGVSGLGCHHQLISSGALTPPPRSRLGTKVEKQSSFHRRFCSSGFLFMSCSLGKPHSTFFRLPRWPFSSATKVNQESPSSCICDSIKLPKIAVLRIHQKNLHLPDVPGPTASYTDHQKSCFLHWWIPCFAQYRATRGSESGGWLCAKQDIPEDHERWGPRQDNCLKWQRITHRDHCYGFTS